MFEITGDICEIIICTFFYSFVLSKYYFCVKNFSHPEKEREMSLRLINDLIMFERLCIPSSVVKSILYFLLSKF